MSRGAWEGMGRTGSMFPRCLRHAYMVFGIASSLFETMMTLDREFGKG